MTLIRQHLTSMKPSTGFLIQDTSDRRNEGRGGEWKVFKKEREKTPLGGLITESYRRLTFSREEVQRRAEGRTNWAICNVCINTSKVHKKLTYRRV